MADRERSQPTSGGARPPGPSSKWPRYGWLVVAALGLIPFVIAVLGLAFANICEGEDCGTTGAWVMLAVGGAIIVGAIMAFVHQETRDR